MINEEMVVGFDLAPNDATFAGKDREDRCWNCAFYSFKTYGGINSTSGKCFRDHEETHHVYYVDGLMTCPGFKMDETSDDPT